MSKRAGESFAASAGAKQRPLHSDRLVARKISTENADTDYHAVRLPVYPAGGDSKREPCVGKILKDSTRRRLEHHAPDNSKQLEHQAPGDQLVQKICQVDRKFIFIQIMLAGSSTIPQRLSSFRAERSTMFRFKN